MLVGLGVRERKTDGMGDEGENSSFCGRNNRGRKGYFLKVLVGIRHAHLINHWINYSLFTHHFYAFFIYFCFHSQSHLLPVDMVKHT